MRKLITFTKGDCVGGLDLTNRAIIIDNDEELEALHWGLCYDFPEPKPFDDIDTSELTPVAILDLMVEEWLDGVSNRYVMLGAIDKPIIIDKKKRTVMRTKDSLPPVEWTIVPKTFKHEICSIDDIRDKMAKLFLSFKVTAVSSDMEKAMQVPLTPIPATLADVARGAAVRMKEFKEKQQ